MTHYILIMYLMQGDLKGLITAEFDSEIACKHAIHEVVKTLGNNYAICVPKSTKVKEKETTEHGCSYYHDDECYK